MHRLLRRRGGQALALGAAILVSTLSLAAQSATGQQPSLARAFLDEARLRADAGDWPGAISLLSEAEESDGSDSDIRYLSALAQLQTGADPRRSLDELDAALSAHRFSYYKPRDALSLKAETLVRVGRYNEALDALVGLDPDADVRWVRCRALAGLGRRDAFDREIQSAFDRFPDDARFPREFLDYEVSGNSPGNPTAMESALAATIRSRLPQYMVTDPELAVLAIPILLTDSDRRAAVLSYRATGPSSARATLAALKYGIIDEKQACTELFGGSYALRLDDLQSALDLARNDEERAEVGAALDRYSGDLVIDRQPGISELAHLDSGKATAWNYRHDTPQGLSSIAVAFSDERPVSAEVSSPDQTMRVSYASYPYCRTIGLSPGDGGGALYRFAPEALDYGPVRMLRLLGQGASQRFVPVATGAEVPSQRACVESALALEETSADGLERIVTSLDRGIPQRRDTWKAGGLYATLSYDHGRPTLEHVDADGDGRFETERIYGGDPEAPVPVLIRMDTTGNGVIDYTEQLVFPFEKQWDFDDDGLMDATQLQQADGSLMLQFSTHLDGRFNESLHVKDGRIIELMRDGRRPPLSKDRNPAVTWIGTKPFDLASNVPSGNGVFTIMSTRIRID
ncbi:MAG TPA: tetratricopeptide repeat protein, partial [Rectinemataceae bacterium]|nr:tetratricopeptide repeat protein [Rectinemataceae bacterium]